MFKNLDTDNLALVSTTLPPNKRFNGRAVWKLLQTKYAGNDLAARSAALDIFLDLEFSTVEKFCPAIRLANQKMVLTGIRLNDQIKILLMLRKLPKEDFQSFRDVVAMGFSTESFESIIKRLESYTVTCQSKDEPSHPIQSMYTKSSGVQGKTGSHLSTPDFVCGHCKKPGHRATNCWRRDWKLKLMSLALPKPTPLP